MTPGPPCSLGRPAPQRLVRCGLRVLGGLQLRAGRVGSTPQSSCSRMPVSGEAPQAPLPDKMIRPWLAAAGLEPLP
jgi:hypothetical protein